VIDFDDCGLSWFFYDFAAAVSFMEHDPVVAELQASWLDGYRDIAPVSHEDEVMLSIFVMESCGSATPERHGAALRRDDAFPECRRHHNFRYPRTIFRILQASPATQNSVCDWRRVRRR
jgi:Ser/Thr protein kinase RdoA (MazF antagonist)